MRAFKIGDIDVGPGFPPVFFAEVGSFFNGDAALALDLIRKIVKVRDAAPTAPVVLKTEILNDPEICLPSDQVESYVDKAGNVRRENYRELIERKSMPLEDYVPIFGYCREQAIPTVVSVYDSTAAQFAYEQGAAALKIASANIVHLPLIEYVARLGRPMVIDTGRSTLHEVARAVEHARENGCADIVVQHSPDGHPAAAQAHNLRMLPTYANAFGLPVGLSDHYVGVEMLYVATALGANVLEKGIYFDPDELDQDIAHSMGIEEFEGVLIKTMDCWMALGSTWRDTSSPLSGNVGSSQRQGLVALRDLEPGEVISTETVRFAWPALGVKVEEWPLVKDWVVKRAISKNSPIEWKDVEAR